MLFEDETVICLFPVLRRAWAMQGEQASVFITSRNAQQVLFCALNIRTGHRIIHQSKGMGQAAFQSFLRQIRRSYRHRAVYMVLDRASPHTAVKSVRLAQQLNIELIWFPKQCSELNVVDHLWRVVKTAVSANYLYPRIEKHAAAAIAYMCTLTNKQTLLEAGILANNFWLRKLLLKRLLHTHLAVNVLSCRHIG